jgi:hypothetical protein
MKAIFVTRWRVRRDRDNSTQHKHALAQLPGHGHAAATVGGWESKGSAPGVGCCVRDGRKNRGAFKIPVSLRYHHQRHKSAREQYRLGYGRWAARSVNTQTLLQSLLVGLETSACRPSSFCNAYPRDPARRKLPGMTANWNAHRLTKEEHRFSISEGKPPPLDTFRSYDYYRLPSIPFV